MPVNYISKINVNSTDYEFKAANGAPTGGSAGQVLSKVSGADFDFAWSNAGGGGGGGGYVPLSTAIVTLASSDWDSSTPEGYMQTVTVTGMTSTANVLVSPAYSVMYNYAERYATDQIVCTAQGTDSLTFRRYASSSSGDIVLNIMWTEDSSDQLIPSGGTTGQVLAKASGTDYDVAWVNQSGLWAESANHGVYFPKDAASTSFGDGSLIVMGSEAKDTVGVSCDKNTFMMMSYASTGCVSAPAGTTQYTLPVLFVGQGGTGSCDYLTNIYFYSEDDKTLRKPISAERSGTSYTKLTFDTTLNPNITISQVFWGMNTTNRMNSLFGYGIACSGQSNLIVGGRQFISGTNNLSVGTRIHDAGTGYSLLVGQAIQNTGAANAIIGVQHVVTQTTALVAGRGHNTTGAPNGVSALGSYSSCSSDTALVVGNGTADNARSNAFEVHSDGRATVGASPTANMDVVTKVYVDDAIAGLDSSIAATSGEAISAFTITDGKITSSTKVAVGETNQNAFSNVKVGSSTISAGAKTDTVELVAGTNVTLTPDTTNKTVTISASGGGTSPINVYSATVAITGLALDTATITLGGGITVSDLYSSSKPSALYIKNFNAATSIDFNCLMLLNIDDYSASTFRIDGVAYCGGGKQLTVSGTFANSAITLTGTLTNVPKAPKTATVTLASDSWSGTMEGYMQTVTVTGMTSSATVWVAPAYATLYNYARMYATDQIVCSAQATDSLTFRRYSDTSSGNIVVNITWIT